MHFSVEKAEKEEGGVLAQLSSFFSMEIAASAKKNHVLCSFADVSHVSIERGDIRKTSAFPANDSEVVDLEAIGQQAALVKCRNLIL